MSVKLTMYLSYGPKREQTVSYAPGGNQPREGERTPMLKICNRLLLESGFTVGSKVEVQYGNGVITISKLLNEQHHANVTKTSSPFAPAISTQELVRCAE